MIIRFGFFILIGIIFSLCGCSNKTKNQSQNNKTTVNIIDQNALDVPPHYFLPTEVQEHQKVLHSLEQGLNSDKALQ